MRIDADTQELIYEEVRRCCERLHEMGCDSVQIMSTANMSNQETLVANYGIGNWYARVGSVQAWLKDMDNNDMARVISSGSDQEDY